MEELWDLPGKVYGEIPKFAREVKKKISEMTKMERWMSILPTNSTITKGRNLP